MPKKRLTEEGVKKLKPPAQGKQIDYYDAVMPGLVLRLNYGGKKTWRALYYVPAIAGPKSKKAGQRISMPTTHELGRFPILSVKAAREQARQFLGDPQKALAQAEVDTFKDVAETFITRYVDGTRDRKVPLRSKNEIVRCLNTYVYPRWQRRPFRDIKRSDVTALLDQIEDNHGPRQADVVLAILRKMMNWHTTRVDDYSSPIVPGMHRHNGGDHKRTRVLSDDEIRALWQAAAGTYGALLKVLLLTGQRKDKVATMKRDDVVAGEWRIASVAREKSNAGTLQLPQAVLDLIAAQPRIAGNPYIFPGRGSGPFNDFSARKADLDRAMPEGVPPWVTHDLRRTAKTLMARAGVRPDISERVLGHTIRGVEGTYDRHRYADEKAEALARLAALVATITNPPPANVVALAEAAPKAGRKASRRAR
jgi:integrase